MLGAAVVTVCLIAAFIAGGPQIINPDKSVLGIVTGIGTARATASIKALGMDPRFDLSKAYWLVAGIAGVNPNEASIGSATWAEWVIDSDLGFEVDAREIPASCTRSAREF